MKRNPSQIRAIAHLSGPMMVLAGPGSGKTSVIVERTAHMIQDGKIPASSILVVTFSRAAAVEMKERFLKSHVFVCASVLENSPNTVGEAMLLGVPVAASWAGGIPDMITDGQEGLLFTKGDPEKLAEAVLRIFGDEAFCVKISEAEKRRARMAHNGVLNYERLLEIYKDICES